MTKKRIDGDGLKTHGLKVKTPNKAEHYGERKIERKRAARKK
jgi:hypothetical protein